MFQTRWWGMPKVLTDPLSLKKIHFSSPGEMLLLFKSLILRKIVKNRGKVVTGKSNYKSINHQNKNTVNNVTASKSNYSALQLIRNRRKK